MRPITEFTDYRAYLRAWLADRPAQRSQRNLARRLGVAPSFVSMVMNGKRGIAPDDAGSWGRAMYLDDEQLEHWVAMVRAAEGNVTERAEAQVELKARQSFARAKPAPVAGGAFGQWHTWAILELARCGGFRADPEWIAATMVPRITATEAREALDALLATELLREEAGDWRVDEAPSAIPNESDRERLERFKTLHRDQLAHASDALDYPQGERLVVSAMFAASRDAMALLKRRLEHAIREAMEEARQLGGPEIVLQVGLQIVPRSSAADADDAP